MTDAERLARLERALECGGRTHTARDVVQLIRDGRAQYWQNGDGCIVTEVEQYPLLKTVRYWLIFGTLKECLALDEPISQWAVAEGCTTAVAMGRKGWGRAGAPYGWREWLPNFKKELVAS